LAEPGAACDRATLEKILDMARWAPSGDNTQVWRFERVGEQLVIHGFDTREHCIYDFDGRASQLALGALIENLSIAAGAHGLQISIERRPGSEHKPTFDVRFIVDEGLVASPLASAIEKRSVQRGALRTRPLTPVEKSKLRAAAGPGMHIVWIEDRQHRVRMALALLASGRLRLALPEAYPVHRDVIDWGARFSTDKVPDRALGVDRFTLRVMRWALQRWSRVRFMNAVPGGTLLPRLQMDLLPNLACGAHFLIVARRPCTSVDDFIAAGRDVQRFWLTATQLGLQLQPLMTPLIFSWHVQSGRPLSRDARLSESAVRLSKQWDEWMGPGAWRSTVFMGRIGAGEAAKARSVRLPLSRLWQHAN